MDPVEIVARIDNKVAVFIGSVTFIIATMGINIVANFVSPAYDFANLFPKHVDFKRGGLITSILAVLVCPWIFVDSPHAITIFVSVFGAILAPLYGVMVADYYLVKREIVNTPELYTMDAERPVPLRRRLEPRRAQVPRHLRLHRHRLGALHAALPHPAARTTSAGSSARFRRGRLHHADAARDRT